MENQNITIQELEQLRSEVAEFKSRLENQEIISQRLLRQAMTGKVSWIKKVNVWVSIAGIFCLPIVAFVMHEVGCSFASIIFLTIMMLCEASFNFWNVSTIRSSQLMSQNILTAWQMLLSFKQREQRQMMIEVPMLILFLVWICFEASGNASTEQHWMGITGLVGGVIGLIVSGVIYVREIRSLNEAVRQIEEFANI